MANIDVQIGQVYRDKDKRMLNRHLRVEYIFSVGDKVELSQCLSDGTSLDSKRRHYVSRKNLQTRFELIRAT